MEKIIFSLYDDENLGNSLAKKLGIEYGNFALRYFPDDEIYLRIKSNVKNKSVILLCFLDHPNNKILLLYFFVQTLKKLGALKVTLIIPYLPYMRQDKEFHEGEAVTTHFFAKFVSTLCDSLMTVDPHLHRIKNLSDTYGIPTKILHCSLLIAEWIKKNIQSPFIIGPDEESAQWVAEIAKLTNANYMIGVKQRITDKQVVIDLPAMNVKNNTPVLIDDIISSGTTMRVLIESLMKKKYKNPICIGIHALFNQNNYDELKNAGAKEIISCNTIVNPTNQINICELLLEGIKDSQNLMDEITK